MMTCYQQIFRILTMQTQRSQEGQVEVVRPHTTKKHNGRAQGCARQQERLQKQMEPCQA